MLFLPSFSDVVSLLEQKLLLLWENEEDPKKEISLMLGVELEICILTGVWLKSINLIPFKLVLKRVCSHRCSEALFKNPVPTQNYGNSITHSCVETGQSTKVLNSGRYWKRPVAPLGFISKRDLPPPPCQESKRSLFAVSSRTYIKCPFICFTILRDAILKKKK